MSDPYFFPFEIVDYSQLITGDNYYIKLNDNVIHKFLDYRRTLPVSHVKGIFVRLHTEIDKTNSTEYAVFKNVRIMNKNYKLGLCNQLLVRYPDGFLAGSNSCDSFSDSNPDPSLRRTINEDREIFFNIKKWMFGIPTEEKLLTEKVTKQIKPKLNEDVMKNISVLRAMQPKGGKTTRKYYKRKRKMSRKRRTHKNTKNIKNM
jgi:hypothetical protein